MCTRGKLRKKFFQSELLTRYLIILQVPTYILGWNHLGCCQEPQIQTIFVIFK